MKMQELIAGIMDLIDQASQPEHADQAQIMVVSKPDPAGQMSPLTQAGDDINRFRQIVALADEPHTHAEFQNEPNEKYADIEAVTTHAGGGVNGPKHPDDLRGNSFRIYPSENC